MSCIVDTRQTIRHLDCSRDDRVILPDVYTLLAAAAAVLSVARATGLVSSLTFAADATIGCCNAACVLHNMNRPAAREQSHCTMPQIIVILEMWANCPT